MTDQEKKPKVCPNCGPGTKTHESEKGTVCETCGGTFTYVAGEAKLAAVGKLDQLQADVEELKKRLPASVPAGEPLLNDEGDEDEEESEDEEEDLL